MVDKARCEEVPAIEGKPDVQQELENNSSNSLAETTISTAEKSVNLMEFSDTSVSSANEETMNLDRSSAASTLNAKKKLQREEDDGDWPIATMKQICVPTFYSPDHLYLNIKSKR